MFEIDTARFLNREISVLMGGWSTEREISIKTGNILRNYILMNKDYLSEKLYPTLYFKSTDVIDFGNNEYKVIEVLA